MSIPIIDIQPLFSDLGDKASVGEQINKACTQSGFFYIIGHGIDLKLQQELERVSWQFFSQPVKNKLQISMEKGGRAWRGYFPVEAELTSGSPDLKEGLYFGEELATDHPMVQSGIPLHGKNLFPDIANFDKIVLDYMNKLKHLGKVLMQGIALSLELPEDYFEAQYMHDPLVLFRIFHYPAPTSVQLTDEQWGVGAHTDYGVLTILKQDAVGGLQVFTKEEWIEAPYIENSFICNVGDMLDLMTRGYYRSTPHRVSNTSGKGRLSFPFFYDLDFKCKPQPLDLSHFGHTKPLEYQRWDEQSLQVFSGSYGDYLLQKISKVFPKLIYRVD